MKSKGGITMKTQEIIKALRSTPSRSKRTLLDKAADRLEQLQNNQRWYNPKDKCLNQIVGCWQSYLASPVQISLWWKLTV